MNDLGPFSKLTPRHFDKPSTGNGAATPPPRSAGQAGEGVADLRSSALPQHDRDKAIRAIRGALKDTIKTHGPIRLDNCQSAAKRIYGHLTALSGEGAGTLFSSASQAGRAEVDTCRTFPESAGGAE